MTHWTDYRVYDALDMETAVRRAAWTFLQKKVKFNTSILCAKRLHVKILKAWRMK